MNLMKTTVKFFLLNIMICLMLIEMAAQPVAIGTTTYDLQTNSSSRNVIRVYPDGKVSAAWIGSFDLATAYADRGTFYNSFNGVSWGPTPIGKEETVRSGFGELLTVGSKEVIISHSGDSRLQIFKNASIGSSTFIETAGSDQIIGYWPNTFCPEGTDDIYVVNPNESNPTAINFSRSMDGGNSWTVLNAPLPFLNAAEGIRLAANSTQIAVFGNDVYVLYGMHASDLVLLHSPMKGNPGTWTKQTLMDFPINNFNGALGQSTDYDGDGDFDTILTHDGYLNMILTDDGVLHFWIGVMRLLDDKPDVEGYNYFPLTSGIWYWNSITETMQIIDPIFDSNNDDGLNDPFAGIGKNRHMYGTVGFTSMVAGAYDELKNRLYTVFAMPIEYSDYFGDPTIPEASSFRDFFGIYSDDNGITWSDPVPLTSTALSFGENAYPMAFPKIVNDKMHIVWEYDNVPGSTFYETSDPPHTNTIKYQAFSPSDFGDTTPVCDIITPPTGLFASPIGTTTVGLHWDAVPLAEKYQVQYNDILTPAIKLKKKSFVNAVNLTGLTPGTTYAWKVKTICPGGLMSPFSPAASFTTLLREGSLAVESIIFPNPTNGVFAIASEGLPNSTATITVINVLGDVIFERNYATANSELEATIDLSSQAAGLYFIQIVSGNVKDTGNLIIE
jgi:hypothetical protein